MNRKLIREIAINYIAWLAGLSIVMFAQVWVEYMDDPKSSRFINYPPFLAIALVVSTTAVIHYYVLYARFFQQGLYWKYVIGVLLFFVATTLLDNVVVLIVLEGFDAVRNEFVSALRTSILRNAFLYTPAIIFYTLIKANVSLRKRRRQLEQQQLESSLAILKHQLDPHFLFNTLNTVYATAMQEKAVKTASSVEELSALFRYSIQEAGVLAVPVEKELAFIEKYLHLQNLRLPELEHVKIKTNINWDKKPAFIAPMLLLPFIENAYKYGISYQQPSQVDIDIKIADAKLEANIVNTDFSAAGNKESNGIGLSNVTRKLELQYPGRYRLLQGRENNLYHVSLSIDL